MKKIKYALGMLMLMMSCLVACGENQKYDYVLTYLHDTYGGDYTIRKCNFYQYDYGFAGGQFIYTFDIRDNQGGKYTARYMRLVDLSEDTVPYITFEAVNNTDEDTEVSVVASTNSVKMPEIVFLKTISNTDNSYMVTFWDNEGNYYSCDDAVLCAVSTSKLIDNFIAYPEQFTLHSQKCDIDALESNYRKVCQIAGEADYCLDKPAKFPAVEARTVHVYGVYYDDAGVVQQVILHEEQCEMEIYSLDERANLVYDWYRESIVIQ